MLLSSLSRGAKRAVVLPSNLGRGMKRAVGSLQVAQGETPTPIFKLERAVLNDSFEAKDKPAIFVILSAFLSPPLSQSLLCFGLPTLCASVLLSL